MLNFFRRCAAVCALAFVESAIASSFSAPFPFEPIDASFRPPSVNLLGAVTLAGEAPDGADIHGLSGLAWDAERSRLYAVSDFGYLVWLLPRFAGGRLAAVEFGGQYPLRDRQGNPLVGRQRDAEGLSLVASRTGKSRDASLLLSFEQFPRAVRYSPTGTYLGQERLPPVLANTAHYEDPNHGFEALTWDPREGYLFGTETALRGFPKNTVALVSSRGRVWHFSPSLVDSALVGIERTSNGEILLLERRYVSPWEPLVISLRVLNLGSEPVEVRELVQLSSANGWPVDNFEGITRHHGDYYFLISDDNANPLQKTILLYFVIKPKHAIRSPE